MAIIILLMACALSSLLVSLMWLMGMGAAWTFGMWFVIMTFASSVIVWRGLTSGPDPHTEADQIMMDIEAIEIRKKSAS